MNKLLMLGSSLASVEIVETAKSMGYYTVVTDNLSPDISPAKKVADEYWMISTDDLDILEERCRKESINAVFAGISEYNLDRVKSLTTRLGLPCYIEEESWKYARDKSAFKAKCREIGLPVVEEYALSDPPIPSEMAGIEYPVVVKPVDGTGNKGLSICCSEEELVAGCEKARNASDSRKILVERYIRGEESWNYYFLAEGEIRFVYSGTVFRQPGYPTFLYLIGCTALADYDEYVEQNNEKCIAFLKNIGVRKGIAWFQFIKDEKGSYYALEMAQRMSADTSGRTIERSVGINSIGWMLDTAFGLDHKASMLPKPSTPPYERIHCVYFVFADIAGEIASIQGYDDLDKEEFQFSLVAHEGMHVDKYRMIARIVFNAVSGKDICDHIRYINENTKVLNADGDNMYIRFTDFDQIIERHKGLFVSE